MTSLATLFSRLAKGLGMALLPALAASGVGSALAQRADAVSPGAAAQVLAPQSGPVELQGQWLQSRDVRARELRSAFKTPEVPAPPEKASASRKLSSVEREALRAQLKGQVHATPPVPDSTPTRP